MRWNPFFILLVVVVSLVSGQREDFADDSDEDTYNVGQIIVHGEERRLTGTDRIAILRTEANNIRSVIMH